MQQKTLQHNGCPIAYKTTGAGSSVIFIQGVGLHGDGWLPQTEFLSSQFRCLTFDNRGMGQSQPAAAKISVEQMAEDAIAILEAENISSAHFVGHSLGGVVALQAALSSPNRIKSLSLLCTSSRGADATALTWKMFWLGMRSRIGTRRMRASAFLEIVMPREYLASCDTERVARELAVFFGHDLADTPPVVGHQLQALGAFDCTANLGELAGIPTLVVSAEHDIIFPPRCGRALAARIPGSRFVELAGVAHGVTLQDPEAINRLLQTQFATSAG